MAIIIGGGGRGSSSFRMDAKSSAGFASLPVDCSECEGEEKNNFEYKEGEEEAKDDGDDGDDEKEWDKGEEKEEEEE